MQFKVGTKQITIQEIFRLLPHELYFYGVTPLYRTHELAFRTLYAELKERTLSAGDCEIDFDQACRFFRHWLGLKFAQFLNAREKTFGSSYLKAVAISATGSAVFARSSFASSNLV